MKEGMKEGRKEKSQARPSEGYKSMMYSIVKLDLVFRLFVCIIVQLPKQGAYHKMATYISGIHEVSYK